MPRLLIAGFLVVFLAVAPGARSQEYPHKPIRIVVGYAAGGGNDIIVRVLAPRM